MYSQIALIYNASWSAKAPIGGLKNNSNAKITGGCEAINFKFSPSTFVNPLSDRIYRTPRNEFPFHKSAPTVCIDK